MGRNLKCPRNSRGMVTVFAALTLAGWMTGCDQQTPALSRPGGKGEAASDSGTTVAVTSSPRLADVPPAVTPRPLTPLLFDLSTTVSLLENVFFDERPIAESIPVARQIEAGVTAYYESLSKEQQKQAEPHVRAIVDRAKRIVSAAEQDNSREVHVLMEELRDKHLHALREMEKNAR